MALNEDEIEDLIQIPDLDEPRYVLAFDPGGTTGVAMFKYTPTTLPELIYLDQIPKGMEGFFHDFEGSFPNEYVAVVSERWVTNNKKKGVDLTPVHIEGVQYALWQGSVFYQDPSMKQIVPDEKLKQHNLWVPGMRHAMDATIHALVWLFRHGHKPTQKALSDQMTQTIADKGEAKDKAIRRDEDGEKIDESGDEQGEGGKGGESEQGQDQEQREVSGDEENETGEGGGRGYTTEVGKNKKARELNRSFIGYDVVEDEEDEGQDLWVD